MFNLELIIDCMYDYNHLKSSYSTERKTPWQNNGNRSPYTLGEDFVSHRKSSILNVLLVS